VFGSAGVPEARQSVGRIRRRLLFAALVFALIGLLAVPAFASAHEERRVGDYTLVVGFIGEPVFAGQKSGLEFGVFTGDEGEGPVEGLEETLTAEVIFGDQRRDLPLEAAWDEPGWYNSYFFPTESGEYQFHITGEIEGMAVDETFTSGPETFGPVEAVADGQFPTVYPPLGDIAAQAEQGAQAATMATIALILGAVGAVLGVIALGMAVGARRRA
jgi:hypothetical protein